MVKTIKQFRRKRKLAMEFENRLIKQARQARRHHSMNFFIARQIDDVIEWMKKSQELIVEYYELRCENERNLRKRLWRLETFDFDDEIKKKKPELKRDKVRQKLTFKKR